MGALIYWQTARFLYHQYGKMKIVQRIKGEDRPVTIITVSIIINKSQTNDIFGPQYLSCTFIHFIASFFFVPICLFTQVNYTSLSFVPLL